jgi:hypothetical protein
LGQTILNFARVVPHGTLVFFPSYTSASPRRTRCVVTRRWRAAGKDECFVSWQQVATSLCNVRARLTRNDEPQTSTLAAMRRAKVAMSRRCRIVGVLDL